MSKAAPQPVKDEDVLDMDGGALDQEKRPERTQADMDAAMAGLIGKLQNLADKQVQLKSAIEQRWLDDLRQFHGRYPVETEAALKLAEKSKLYVNLTRAKVNSWEARLTDLLFPTDDKNWGIAPMPAPHLADQVIAAMNAAKAAAVKATEAHQQGNPEQGAAIAKAANDTAAQGVSIQEVIDEAKKRCGLMESQIDTQLKDCEYNIRSREVIRDAIKIGTGIMKGPITSQKLRRSWIKSPSTPPAPSNDIGNMPMQPTDESAQISGGMPAPQPGADVAPSAPGTGYVLDQQPDPSPEFIWVDPWSYFPDMSARTPDEAEFHFERHLWNPKQLRKAVKTTGLKPEAVAELLRGASQTTIPTYWAQLREITANSAIIGMEARYQVWEYHGVLEDEDLETIASITGDQTVLEYVKDNPLLEVPVIVWFCQGKLLKYAPFPLDSGESLYSIFNFEPDDTSIFGFGVPYLQRDSQSALNGAWRMMMDNGGLSVGPQIVMDTDAVKPADGSWVLRPMKVWLKSSTSLTKAPESYKPFETFQVQSNQAQLQAIIEMAQKFADEETSMPLIAAGGMDSHITKTSGGMSMLMNSANVVFRRLVKNFDDTFSTPNIRRLYDWNMQFSPRDDLKGDYCVDARGSSVLLVKEMQTQTLMTSLQQFGNHPIFGPMLKGSNLLRKLFQAQMIHADDAVKADDVIEQEAEARAQQAQSDPAVELAKVRAESAEKIADARGKVDLQVAELGQQTAMLTLAANHNVTLDELQTKLQVNKDNIAHRERVLAVEMAMPKEVPQIGGSEFGPRT